MKTIDKIKNHFLSGKSLTVRECTLLYGTADLRKYVCMLERKPHFLKISRERMDNGLAGEEYKWWNEYFIMKGDS